MAKYLFLKISFLVFLSGFYPEIGFSCSMYKVTASGKTMVGNNEDSWGRDARIWFEQGKDGRFGVACVGYARKYPRPDGAMNECGLVFDAFTMPHKSGLPERDPNKKDLTYEHVKTIMQQCKTVDDVYDILKEMNLHILNGSILFNGGMLLFVDKTGKYLVVEAGKTTFGNDDKFALTNFSIADTKDLSTIKTERYCKGVAYMNNKKAETSLSFCTGLSDTMSVSRAKVGDGTLYTSIYDLEEGMIYLYFFHDFDKRVTFNLNDEIAKGDHAYDFVDLFPGNQNFQKFLDYKTPQNSRVLFAIVFACGLLFFFSGLYFLINFFKAADARFRFLMPVLSLMSIALCFYTYVLLINEAIFYFPSPYQDARSLMVTITSYLPFVLLVAIIPLLYFLLRIFRKNEWRGFARYLFATNSLAYVVLTVLFFYWKLFDISFS